MKIKSCDYSDSEYANRTSDKVCRAKYASALAPLFIMLYELALSIVLVARPSRGGSRAATGALSLSHSQSLATVAGYALPACDWIPAAALLAADASDAAAAAAFDSPFRHEFLPLPLQTSRHSHASCRCRRLDSPMIQFNFQQVSPAVLLFLHAKI